MSRFNDKVMIEMQINEARKGDAWDITRHHLKQARAQLDREREKLSRRRRAACRDGEAMGGCGSGDGDGGSSAAGKRWRRFVQSHSAVKAFQNGAGGDVGGGRMEPRGLSISLDLSGPTGGGGSYPLPWLCNGGGGGADKDATRRSLGGGGGQDSRSSGRYAGSSRSDETLYI